jgi:hypothetical protein
VEHSCAVAVATMPLSGDTDSPPITGMDNAKLIQADDFDTILFNFINLIVIV